MALKVVDDHYLLVGRIIFGILNLVNKMGFGLCKQFIKINFFHSIHFSNMNPRMNLFMEQYKKVDHKEL